MKTLTLNESKWRCGATSKTSNNRRGNINTETLLLNDQGRMCCLGQFALQLNRNLKPKDIRGKTDPRDLNVEISGLITPNLYGGFVNSDLAGWAIKINDDDNTTVEEKVKLLKELFAKHGYKIVFKKKNK